MKGKKGMGVGQVFVFIIAAFSFALIMIFGFKAISGFLESGGEVEFVRFRTDLETSIKRIYTEYGAVRHERYSLAGNFEKICFVDMDYPLGGIEEEMDDLCRESIRACDVWEEAKQAQIDGREGGGYGSVEENVFLTPEAPHKIKVYKISIYDENSPNEKKGFLCERIRGGGFGLVLEGKGDRTELSRMEG